MKDLNVLITVVSSILSGVIFSGVAQAGVLTFHPEFAVYAGSGCPQGMTRLMVDETGDLLIEHEALRLDLQQGVGSALAGRRACAIRVPVTLPQGFYVRSIEQQLHYSAMKSAGAESRISTRAAMSGDSVDPFTITLPLGEEIYGDNMIASRRDDLDEDISYDTYCKGSRSEEMMLQVNTVISGQRQSIYEDLLIAAYGGYIGEGIEIEIAECY